MAILSLPTAVSTGSSTANIGVTTDTVADVWTLLLPAGDAAPVDWNALIANPYAVRRAVTSSGVQVWAVTGLTPNVSLRAHFTSDSSNVQSSTSFTPPVDTAQPSLTGTVTLTNLTYTGYTLTWPAASDNVGVTGYDYSLDGGASYTPVGNVLSVNISGRSSGVTDQIRIRARDAAGNLSAPVLSTSVLVPTLVLRNLNTTVSGRKIMDTYRTGVLGSSVPADGTYPSMLYGYVNTNSLQTSEVSAYVESTTLPAGSWFAYNDGSLYVAPFASPGGYTMTVRYRIFGVDQGTNTVTVLIGTVASAVTLSGPSGGGVGLASTNFTVGTNGNLSTTVIVTPNDGGQGGTFFPASVSLSLGVPTGTFTYTPASLGTKTISVTNDGGLGNPTAVSYLSADATLPILTGSVTPSNISYTTATISWPTASDNISVTGYDLSMDGGSTWTPLGLVNTHNLTGLTSGLLYTPRIRARDDAGNFSSPVISGSFTTLILYSLTTSALKNVTGTLLTNVPVEVFVNSTTNGDLVVKKTGLTSHASTAVVTFTDPSLVGATPYHLVIRRTDTGAEGWETRTSA